MADLLNAMRDAQREERAATARRLLATGRFTQCRLAELGDAHDTWCVDDWEAVAAEVRAELGITSSWASSQMHQGVTLIERLPRLGEVFATGAVDYRVVSAAVSRTALLVDTATVSEVDAQLAERAPEWNTLSRRKVCAQVDWLVVNLDPDAVRVARRADEERHIDIEPGDNGTAEISGTLRATSAAALDQRLDELAATVCADDPRTKRQRRADALDALTTGGAALACDCGSAQCPARPDGVAESKVVIHLIAEEATVRGDGARPAVVPGSARCPPTSRGSWRRARQCGPCRGTTASSRDTGHRRRWRPSSAAAISGAGSPAAISRRGCATSTTPCRTPPDRHTPRI